MYRFLSCFQLKPGVSIDEYAKALAEFTRHLQESDLIDSVGPIGRRHRHPVMDTDSEREHEYYFISSFRDREQCDRAVEYIQSQREPAHSVHHLMYSKIFDSVFICWEDIDNEAPG